jgi:hypothetical protein
VDVSKEFVRYWWHRLGSQFASQIKKRGAGGMQSSNWKWHFGWRLDVKKPFFLKRPFQAQNRKSLFHEPE